MRVTFLVNGPGELWGWARPLSREMSLRGWKVTVRLLPCPFASGEERSAARHLNISSVHGPHNWIKTLWKFRSVHTDLVVQLGGDLMFGKFLARCSGAPLACYTYGDKRGLEKCDLVSTAFPSMAEKISVDVSTMGDLVYDGLCMEEEKFLWKSGGPRVVFFPGSRPEIRRVAMNYLGEVIACLRSSVPELQYVTLMSPFITKDEIELWNRKGLCPVTVPTGKVLKGADLAVTQPGTNTLEILHSSVPALVAVPFCFLQSIPLSGLKGLISSMPGGKKLKDIILRKAASKRGFLAWPNRLMKREIMPELVGDISHKELAGHILAMLQDRKKLDAIRGNFKQFNDHNGSPSRVFCDALERLVVKKNER